jgi:glycosyltransferase involved in cell wall biosynthesis
MAEVTVLMPVRNGARFLEPAIGSILAQNLRSFEFIICDDGSTDETPQILARSAARDGRIRVITLPSGGLVAALNTGMLEARTGWVARMDADDVAWSDRLAVQLAAARAHPGAAGIASAWRIIDENGRPGDIVRPPTGPAAIADALLQRNCLAHPTMLLNRQAVLDAGGYRAAFRQAEDYDLWLRLSERFALHAVPRPLLDYREHALQVSQSGLEQRILAEFGAQVAARARRRGKVDPAADAVLVDRAWLEATGVSRAELRHRMIAGALGAAVHAVRTGQKAAAREALGLLYAQRDLHPRTRLHALLLHARATLMTPPPS